MVSISSFMYLKISRKGMKRLGGRSDQHPCLAKLPLDSYTQDYVFRGAGRKTMPRGEYQVEATPLEAVPALQHVSTEFFVGSNFKIGPNKEKCS